MVAKRSKMVELDNMLGLATLAVGPTLVGVAPRNAQEAGHLQGRLYVMGAANLAI